MKQFKFADDVDVVIEGDWFGNTPLHLLAYDGNIVVLKHKSVDVVKNKFGQTPLHILAMEGKIEVLSHKSVDVVKCNNGQTPRDIYNLHLKDTKGEEMKQFKFADDVDVAIEGDFHSNTPLHYLALKGEIEVLNHPSVDVVKNDWGETPRDYYNRHLKGTKGEKMKVKEAIPLNPAEESIQVCSCEKNVVELNILLGHYKSISKEKSKLIGILLNLLSEEQKRRM